MGIKGQYTNIKGFSIDIKGQCIAITSKVFSVDIKGQYTNIKGFYSKRCIGYAIDIKGI
jgi:hypothetical protein